MEAHVVSKVDNSQHAAVTVEKSLSFSLAPSSIRVRSVLVGLTSNNLTYAGADHWWNTYPVSSTLPAPYNDSGTWGIVPAWGYAVVLESTTSIQTGALIWGFFPTSAVPVDLKLKSSLEGHWIETSDHRKGLLTVYNRYHEVLHPSINPSSPSFTDEDLTKMAWTALFQPTWSTGFLMNRFVFPPNPEYQSPIHPMGMGLTWTPEDGDITSAVVVILSASSKTARSAAYHLAKRRSSAGPLGMLQITSSPAAISEAANNLKSTIPIKVVDYSDVSDALRWMAGLKPSKIVILDFGGRGNAVSGLHGSIKAHSDLQALKLAIIQIGNEQKIYSEEELSSKEEEIKKLGKIKFNSSTLRDSAVGVEGPQAYFRSSAMAWNEWFDARQRIVPGMDIVVGQGVAGESGLENGWTRLCQSSVGAQEGLVYKL